MRFFAAMLLLTGTARPAVQNADWITAAQQVELVTRVRAALPSGWTISQVLANGTPADWYTLDNRGIQIDGSNGAQTFRTWVLPKDWIGIRQFRPNRSRIVYWEGILMDSNFKTITNTDLRSIHEALQKPLGSTPSITNGGWDAAQRIFKDRMTEIDRQAQTLVDRFCNDRACRDEAAYSLIVLGVPSRTLTMDCAEHGSGDAQHFCASTLGYLGGKDSTRLLEKLLTDPSTTPGTQKYLAGSLDKIGDPSSAPALHRALQMNLTADTLYYIVGTLDRFRYAPAAPDILHRMQTEPRDAIQQGYYAKALASLRYKPAIPALEALSSTRTFTAEWVIKEQRNSSLSGSPAIALMRMTASWGESSDGVRLLLLPSENVAGPIRIAIVMENTGDSARPLLMNPRGVLVVDGKKYAHSRWLLDGNPYLGANAVYPIMLDLSSWITDEREHRIEYEFGSAVSNTLIVKSPQGKTDSPAR
jgi:hypothetical protein